MRVEYQNGGRMKRMVSGEERTCFCTWGALHHQQGSSQSLRNSKRGLYDALLGERCALNSRINVYLYTENGRYIIKMYNVERYIIDLCCIPS